MCVHCLDVSKSHYLNVLIVANVVFRKPFDLVIIIPRQGQLIVRCHIVGTAVDLKSHIMIFVLR